MRGKEDRYLRYCEDTGTHYEPSRKEYLSVLMKMDDIYIPSDLVGRTLTTTQSKALMKFYGFVETDQMLTAGFNGYSKAQWSGNQKRTKNNAGTRADLKTKDLTPEEVRTVRDKLEPVYQVFYSLVAYSGARSEHLYQYLSNQKRTVEEINGIIRADVRDTAAGKKKEAYLYFPKEMKNALLAYTNPATLSTIQDKIKVHSPKDRPVNLSSLRKWNFNILLDHMDRVYANAIQGRAAAGVDARHYMDVAGKAAQHYPDAVPELLQGLPVPDWMQEGKWDMPKSSHYIPDPKNAANHKHITDRKRSAIINKLKKGVPVKTIAKQLHTGPVTIRNIRNELGLKDNGNFLAGHAA